MTNDGGTGWKVEAAIEAVAVALVFEWMVEVVAAGCKVG